MPFAAGRMMAAVLAEGIDVFPMVVSVVDEKGNPVANASVSTVSLPEKSLETMTDPKAKARLRRAFRVATTDEYGFGLAFFLSNWTLELTADKRLRHRDGTIRVEVKAAGFQNSSIEWIEDQSVPPNAPESAPVVTIILKKLP